MSLHILNLGNPLTLNCNNATFLATIDGNRCKTKEQLLNEFASVFSFPKHYGHNFDALHDCLTDLEWLGVDSIYLLIIHPALICSDEDEERTINTFFQVLKGVLKAYLHHPIHFHLIAEKSFLNLVNPETH